MRHALIALVTLLGMAGLVQAQAASAASPAAVDSVLQQLEQVGKSLREFSARIKLIETDNTLGEETVRAGDVWYQKRPDGSARIHVLLNRRIAANGKQAFPEKIEYLLDGPWLTDRNYQTKVEVRRQVLKPGQKMDLFKLGEGPFPMPIGQTPQDVHRLFDVKMLPLQQGEPAGTAHLQLIPRPGTDLAQKFAQIDVWVDQRTAMPARIDTLDNKKQTIRSTELSNVALNPPQGLKDADFALPNIDDQRWNRSVEMLQQK